MPAMHSWLSVPHSQRLGTASVRGRTSRTQASKMLALAEQDAHVRAEKFVGRTDEEIAIEGGDVDQAMRAVVDGVNVGEGSGGMGEADDLFDGIDGADSV